MWWVVRNHAPMHPVSVISRAERTDVVDYPLQESLATPPEKFVQCDLLSVAKVVGSGGFTLSLSAFEVRVEKAFRMHAISIAHETGFKNRIAQQFLNSFWQMARFVRRHGQQKRLQLPQPGLAVLYRNP